MDNNPTHDRTEVEKLLAELDTVDFDSLDQDFRGVAVDEEQWRKYQMIVKELLTIPMPEDIRRRIYAEAGFDFSGSVCSVANLSDLDETAIETFRVKWVEKSSIRTLSRSWLI